MAEKFVKYLLQGPSQDTYNVRTSAQAER